MKKFALSALLLALLLVSCSSTNWAAAPYKMYSSSEYICAVGCGRIMAEAEEEAKINLATLFGASVNVETTRTVAETSSYDSLGREYSGYGEYFSRTSGVSVKAENLYGLKIVQRKTEKDGTCIALAVMEKRTTRDAYKAQLAASLGVIAELESRIPQEIGTFKGLEDAVSLAKMVEEYNTLVVMYNYLSGEDLPLHSMVGSYVSISDARRAIVLNLDVEGDVNGTIESVVTKVLTGVGLSVTRNNPEATAGCWIRVNWIETQGTGIAASFVFEQYNVDISLLDTNGNQTVFSYSTSGKEGHQSYDSAKIRAVAVASGEIEDNLYTSLKEKYSL